MIAGIYIRVSTEDQKDNYSLTSQLKACKSRAKMLGATKCVEYIDDGYSGAFLDRPGMNQLREDIRNKNLNMVICHDPDRFARKLVHQLLVTEEIEKSGANIDFVNSDYKDTPEGRLFYSIRGAFSEYEREKIKERSIRGKRAKAEAGKIVNNSKPYGYRYDKQTSSYVIEETEAEMVRNIFKWYTEEKIGMLQIAERLVMYEYPTRTGKRSWSTSSINGILKNEIYTGIAYAFKTYKKKIGPKKYEKGIRPIEEWVPISVPPIIDQATFEAAQRQAVLNSKLSNRNTKREYLLRGLLECPICGNTLLLHHSRGHGYYRCQTGKSNNKKYMDTNVPICPVRTIPARLIEDLFWQKIILIASNPKLLSETLKTALQDEKTNLRDIDLQLDKLAKHESKLKVTKEKILKLYRQDLITEKEAEKELKEIREILYTLSLERKKLEGQNTKQEIPIEERLKIFNCDMPFDQKRAAILDVIDKVVAKRVDNNWGGPYSGNPKIEMTIKLKI